MSKVDWTPRSGDAPIRLGAIVGLWHFLPLGAVVLVVLVALKRRYLSAISDIPGPFLATISGILWHVRWTFNGHLEEEMMDLHKKHGHFVRIGHNEVSISHPDAVEKLLLARIRKGEFYKAFSFPDDRYVNQMSELDPTFHVHKNKNIVAGYQLSNIMRSESFIDECVTMLEGHLDRLAQDGKAPVDLSRWFNYYAFDVVGEVTFSRRFGFLDTGLDVGGAYANGRMVLIYLSLIGRAYFMHKFLMANPLLDRFGWRPNNHLEDTTVAAIASRQSNPEVRRDMMEHWLDVRQKHPERMEEKEIFCGAISNVAAGSDTVGGTTQAFFYHLLKNPKYLSRLREEMDAAQAAGELSGVPTYNETQKLPYLQACIKETYRIHPAVGFHYPRVAPDEGITVGGRFFPKGTIVSIHPWVLHRDPSIFGADAESFNPERWLDSDDQVKYMNKFIINFGAGYNACPGRHLAHLEISKVTATLVRDYDIELVDPKGTWTFSNHFLIVPHGWPCYLRRRTTS